MSTIDPAAARSDVKEPGEATDESSTTEREVTLDEAMTIAVGLQRGGRLQEAEGVYRKILELVPDHAAAMHYLGVLTHQQGQSAEALVLIERSLELSPEEADGYSNLGIVLKAMGRGDEAIAAYERAVALDPGHANAYNNLGVLFKQRGRLADAEEAYRTAIRLNPEHVDAYNNLGSLLASQKRTQEAVACYCRVTTLNPKHQARRLLAMAHCTLGEVDKAVEILRKWLEDEPDNPVARHTLAACSGQNVPERASDAYVEKVFDDFAATFDKKLATLTYRAPMLVAAVLEDSGAAPAKALEVLDAGCGTGWCGPLVAPFARRLIGVDLSGRMLAEAEGKHVYDELVKDELTAYLRRSHERFDLIISADTLVYFGALDEVMVAAARALRPGGLFIFTLEEATGTSASHDYSIKPHGRYSHTRRYIERLLEHAGLERYIVEAELRMEAGAPVAGLVVRARRPLAGENHV